MRMRRLITAICCLALIFSVCTPAVAAERENVIFSQEIDLGNGITLVDEIIEHTQARATGKTYTRTNTYRHGDDVIAVISVQATFHYDGTTVSVASKSVTQTDTYEGWNYKQNSFTSSGSTVTLDAKLTKLLVLRVAVNISITCDKNGNIS